MKAVAKLPQRLGFRSRSKMLDKGTTRGYKIDRTFFDDLVETLENGSLCAHWVADFPPVRKRITNTLTKNFRPISNKNIQA